MEILLVIAFIWLAVKAMGLCFKVAWGTAKIAAFVLLVMALPVLIGCLLFAGGVVLLIPVALVGIAFGLLKKCI